MTNFDKWNFVGHVFGSVGFINSMCKLKVIIFFFISKSNVISKLYIFVGCSKMIQVIENDTGVKLGPNQVGEICVKSPFMLTEYLNRPEV